MFGDSGCKGIEELKGYAKIEQDKILQCREFTNFNAATFDFRSFPKTEPEEKSFHSQVSKYAACEEWQTGESLQSRLFGAWSALCGNKNTTPKTNAPRASQLENGAR